VRDLFDWVVGSDGIPREDPEELPKVVPGGAGLEWVCVVSV